MLRKKGFSFCCIVSDHSVNDLVSDKNTLFFRFQLLLHFCIEIRIFVERHFNQLILLIATCNLYKKIKAIPFQLYNYRWQYIFQYLFTKVKWISESTLTFFNGTLNVHFDKLKCLLLHFFDTTTVCCLIELKTAYEPIRSVCSDIFLARCHLFYI